MKTTYTIAAIAMFAVILGMGALSPALADREGLHNPKVPVCHFDKDTNDDGDETIDDRAWIVKMVNKHAKIAHLGHGDVVIDDDEVPVLETISSFDCENQLLPDPDLII